MGLRWRGEGRLRSNWGWVGYNEEKWDRKFGNLRRKFGKFKKILKSCENLRRKFSELAKSWEN